MENELTYTGYLIMIDNLVLCTDSISSCKPLDKANYYFKELSKINDYSEAIITWIDNLTVYLGNIRSNKNLCEFIEKNVDITKLWMLQVEITSDGELVI